MKIIVRLLFIAVLSTGCSTVAQIQTDDLEHKYPATNSSQIEVYSMNKIEKEYSVIGQVIASADAGTDASVSINLLKKEAAKLGADAILNMRLEIGYGYWSSAIKSKGTAIKFNN